MIKTRPLRSLSKTTRTIVMPIELTKQHLKYMGIGKRYWPARLAMLSPEQKSPIESYIANLKQALQKGVGLYLWGDNSMGKTYIASALCKYVWGMFRVSSYFVTATDLYEAWKRDRPAHEDSDESLLSRVANVRFLVIDDVGREYRTHSGFSEVHFGALLRHRARENKTTVITTNMAPPEMKEVYGNAAGELCKESFYIVQIVGRNMREPGSTSLEERLNG
jgi:DNA replication protein DnaC